MERGWGANNLALLANREKDFVAAQAKYLEAITHFENAAEKTDDDYQAQKEIANSLGGLAQVTFELGHINQTTIYRQRQSSIYSSLIQRRPNDFYLRNVYAQALSRLVTEGLLDDKPELLRETISNTCSEFERLIDHDKENQIWRKNYYISLNEFLSRAEKFDLVGVDREDLNNRITTLSAQ